MTQTASRAPNGYPAAGLDRRFYAFVLDRLLVWGLYAVAAFLAYRSFFSTGRAATGVGVVVAVVLVLGLAHATLLGLAGLSPGKAAAGLRVVDQATGRPIGLGRAVVRTLVLGLAALPTFTLGVASLAWTAVMDRSGFRRGWHDQVTGSVVVDVRPVPAAEVLEENRPRQVVNLTAMRLMPAPSAPDPSAPAATAAPAPPSPALTPAAPRTSSPPPPRAHRAEPSLPRPGPQPETVGEGSRAVPPAPLTAPVPTPVPTPLPTPLSSAPPPPLAPPSGPPALATRPPAPPSSPPSAARPSGPPSARPPAPAPAHGPPSAAGAGSSTTTGWRVAFDTGEAFVVEGLALVGRRPEGRAGESVRHLVPLRSTDMSLSKTHAQFQVTPDGVLVVMDRGSTNGSVLVRQGVAKVLSPGRASTLLAGDRVRFGDREMRVERG